MKQEAIRKINRFGKIGNIVAIVLIVCVSVGVAGLAVGTIGVATLPNDMASVTISGEANIHIKRTWLQDTVEQILPELQEALEDADLKVKTTLGNADYSVANVTKTDQGIDIGMRTKAYIYRFVHLFWALLTLTVYCICILIALILFKKLMKAFAQCETPFCKYVIRRMRYFAFSLIPLVVFSIVSNMAWSGFLSAGDTIRFSPNLGGIITILVIFVLVSVFKYGAQLQEESDETL